MKVKILFIILICIASVSNAQNIKKLLKNANSFYDQAIKDQPAIFEQAIPAYLEVLKVDPSNAEANYKIGVSYLNSKHKLKSLPYLEKAYKINPQIGPDLLYQLARSRHFNHQFEKALEAYKEYKKTINPKDVEQLQKLDKKIFECENGMEYIKSPVKVQITNMGTIINSNQEDFAPVITPDESILVFTSRRNGSTGGLLDEDPVHHNEPFEDVYISYQKNGVWTEPKNVGKPINSDGHDASIAISSDGNQIYIYKYDDNGSIYVSKFAEGNWSKPEDLGKNINTKYRETSVTLSSDGQTIYFTSERPGGQGGMDIYMSKKDKKGRWGEAVNLGNTINTPYDEESPFLHPDGRTLYFSSTGHAGMGAFDIFKSTLKSDGKWSEPENLGYPINTADNDIYFVLSANNKHGYYSSEREDGLGNTDLYMISMPEPEKLASVSSKELKNEKQTSVKRKIATVAKVESFNPITILKGTVSDAITKDKLEADLVIIDNDKNEVISELKSNAETGTYLVILPSGKNYGIRVQHPDYLFHSENFDIPASTNYQEIVKDVELKKVAIGTKIVLRNIFFDFDKATLRPQSTAELERLYQLLIDVPKLKIEISGHTDNKGSEEYNKDLSERRAKAVVDYLVGKGIDSSRLKYAGYGFDRPISSNDTEEGRQLNRRTEFEIIGN